MSAPRWSRYSGSSLRTYKIITVVLCCPSCGREHVVGVRLEDDGSEPIALLPDNCGCGEPLDTPCHHVYAQDTALRLLELAALGGDAA